MRRAAAILALLTLACEASPGAAQVAVRPRTRPVASTSAPEVTHPPPPLPAPAATGRLTLKGLPDRTDAAPVCRAQCAKARLVCEAVAETCVPEWTACLRRCAAA